MLKNEKSRSKAFILNDYKRITNSKNEQYEFSVGLINDNIYTWEVIIIGPQDTPFENGIYKAEMIFPINYPEAPPTFRFITKMWHPNIDKNGNVCISILHKSGNDEYGYEDLNERWLPVRTPESVILSIISLLNSPNCESPANLEASQNYRENIDEYNKRVRRYAEKSLEE
ncbi:ubiquitin-protein ligase [Enterocytozoon bieneusi H348]|nr:ubiquitin-protein ligase [Enterocytozoon bieneusi H348]|eukprot:XP_001827833.1 ubiquitin-protein ligase [Enterocytozoon bieneusi H348]